MHSDLVNRFCTPPFLPVTDFDRKVVSGASITGLPFESTHITCYSWGTGQPVLLLHGWGSRASHLALLARNIADAGFRVVAFDAPAHSSTDANNRAEKSIFFEFSRAVLALSKTIGPFYAIAGHSLGAAAALFAVAGHPRISEDRATVEKLILISAPVSFESMVSHFCRSHNLGPDCNAKLKEGLEKGYDFLFDDFSAVSALKTVGADTLLIHDTDDDELPVEDIYGLHETCPETELYTTQGAGHFRILMNRMMIAKVREFLTKNQ